LIVNVRDEQAEAVAHRPRDPAMLLAELAAEVQVTWLAAAARDLADQHPRDPRALRTRQQRLLCLGARLGYHLSEQSRALERGASSTLARANALSLVRAMSRTGRAQPAPPPACAALARQLATERTKFLMSNTADALLALESRLVDERRGRRELHALAAEARVDLAGALLGELERRACADVERTVGEVARSLLAEIESSLADLGEQVSHHAFAGFDMVVLRGPRPRQPGRSPPLVAPIADLVRFWSRRQIMARARHDLLESLADSSRDVIERARADCEAACTSLAARLGEHLDTAIESVLAAMQLAETAHRAGHDHVARTRQRLVRWAFDLEDILTSLR